MYKTHNSASLSFLSHCPWFMTHPCGGVLHGSVVKCLTLYPGVLGSSSPGSSGFFHGSVLWQDTSEPQPSTGESQEEVNNVNRRSGMTETLLKVV